MPDPRTLKIGDYVRWIAIPDEWKPGYTLHRDSLTFMKRLIGRRFPSRVFKVDEYGYPWIRARMRNRGRLEYHTWMIVEKTGWRKVRHQRRKKSRR